MAKIDIIGIGALNADHIYRVERILDDGEAVVEDCGVFPGGSAANTIYGLAKLGISAAFIGAMGDDVYSKMILADFEQAGADTSRIRIKHEAGTGETFCITSAAGKRAIYVMPCANDLLTSDDLNPAFINQAGWLHVSSLAGGGQLQMLCTITERLSPSVRLSFSPGALYAARGLDEIAPLISRSHVVFLNKGEVHTLTGKDFAEGSGILLKQGCRMVVVTLGKGVKTAGGKKAVCYIRDASGEYFIEGRGKDDAPDTTGAGDALAAGFLFGLIKGKPLLECGRLGVIAARCCIGKMGARQGLPGAKELDQAYSKAFRGTC
jgi:ribokinase